MIKARRQKLPLWFFTTYFRVLQKFLFRKVEFIMLNSVPEGPVLLIQNHFSWWDGYWSYYVAEKILGRNFHVMMLEEQLQKRMFLARTGAFSVNPNGNNLLASMRYASGLLSDSKNVVTIYPQGAIQSHYQNKIQFEKGAEILLRLSSNPVNLVFAVARISYGTPVRPKATVFVKYIGNNKVASGQLEEAFNDFYTHCTKETIDSEF